MTEQIGQGHEESPERLLQSTEEAVGLPDRSDRFAAEGVGSVIFKVSPDTAEKIQQDNGGVLPDHIQIREDLEK